MRADEVEAAPTSIKPPPDANCCTAANATATCTQMCAVLAVDTPGLDRNQNKERVKMSRLPLGIVYGPLEDRLDRMQPNDAPLLFHWYDAPPPSVFGRLPAAWGGYMLALVGDVREWYYDHALAPSHACLVDSGVPGKLPITRTHLSLCSS